jgi:hypothetical protein
MKTRGAGPGRGGTASGGRRVFAGRVNTAGLGVEGAPTPVAARACGTWKPRQGPVAPPGAAGKPEATMAQFPGGNRMLKKRTPVRRKATGNRDRWPALRRPSRITGRIPGLGARTRKGADVGR